MIMQILVGVFLEMEQDGWFGSVRVAIVYFAGVAAGSLGKKINILLPLPQISNKNVRQMSIKTFSFIGTSLSDPYTYIAGASGGVYALIAAHLATLALNWREDSAVRIRKVIHRPLTRVARLAFILLLTAHDVAFAVYVRFFSDGHNRTGFMVHLCGALAGLLVGVFVLDNRRVRSWEPCVQWVSLAFFLALVAFGVFWNVFGDALTDPGDFFPNQDHRPYDDESGNCKHYDYF